MQTFLSKYVKLIKKLDSRIKKNIDTKDTTCDELKTQLETLNQSFRTLHKENEELTQKLLYTQNKLQQVSSENQKESAAKVTEMAEKLKVNAFFVICNYKFRDHCYNNTPLILYNLITSLTLFIFSDDKGSC